MLLAHRRRSLAVPPLVLAEKTRFSQNPCPEERATAEVGGGREAASSARAASAPAPPLSPPDARRQGGHRSQPVRLPRSGQPAASCGGCWGPRCSWHRLRLPRRKAFAAPGSQDCSGPRGASHWTGCAWSRPALGEDARSGSLSVSACPETPSLLWTKATPVCFCWGLGRRMLKL